MQTAEILSKQSNHTPNILRCLSSVNLKQGKDHTFDIPTFCLKNIALVGQKKHNT
jgi:hypothetical protein